MKLVHVRHSSVGKCMSLMPSFRVSVPYVLLVVALKSEIDKAKHRKGTGASSVDRSLQESYELAELIRW